MIPRKVMFPVRDVVLNLLRQHKIDEAYEVMFNQFHGNPQLPQYHNIYLPDMNRDEVAIFKGTNFILDAMENRTPKLFEFLRHEMRRIVLSYPDVNDLTRDEKDELNNRIIAHWNCINEKKDLHMKRTLFNNKSTVFETFEKNRVHPHTDMLISECKYAGLPVPEFDRDHLVKLL